MRQCADEALEIDGKLFYYYLKGPDEKGMTCGAISGLAAVVGMIFAQAENTPENKKDTYAIVQELCAKFKAETGSLICAELLSGVHIPVEVGGEAEVRSKEYYEKRPCADMVALAAQILEEYLQGKEII